MELQITQDQATAIASMSGQFTFVDHALFSSVLALVELQDVNDVIIDVGKMDFIDSAGLGMLLMLREACYLKNKPLVLLNPVGHVQKVFQVAKFDEIFTLESSRL